MKSIQVSIGLMALLVAAPAAMAQDREDLSGHWRIPSADGPKGSVVFGGRQAGEGGDTYTVTFSLPGGESVTRAGTFDGTTLTIREPEEAPEDSPAEDAAGPSQPETFARGARGALAGEGEAPDREEAPEAQPATDAPAEDPAPPSGTYTLGDGQVTLGRTWALGSKRKIGMRVFKAAGEVDPQGNTPVARFGRADVRLTIVPGKRAKDAKGIKPGDRCYYRLKVEPKAYGSIAWSCDDADVSLLPKGDDSVRLRDETHGGRTITLKATFNSKAGSVHTAELPIVVRPQVQSIEVASITYDSDHGLLTDNATTWSDRGTALPEPEWTASDQHPISHTMDEPLTVTVSLTVTPENALPAEGTLVATGPNGLELKATRVEFKAGTIRVTLNSGRTKLPKRIAKIDLPLTWSVQGLAGLGELQTTTTPMYLTIDTPRTPSRRPGVTVKRMEKAVAATSASGSLDPPTVVKSVISTWNHYNLQVAYRNAWELGDDKTDPTTGKLIGADCQTIVRFTQNVIAMVGLPGDAEFVVVWAKVKSPEKGEESVNARRHMTNPAQRHPTNSGWIAALVDGGGGLNNYEAALRFSHNGKRYYPGGVNAVFKNPDEVIKVFTTMSWVDLSDRANAVKGHIHRYRQDRP